MYIYIHIYIYIYVNSQTRGLQAKDISKMCIHTHIYTFIYKFTAFKFDKYMYLTHLSVFGPSNTRNIFICVLRRPNTHTHSHTHTRATWRTAWLIHMCGRESLLASLPIPKLEPQFSVFARGAFLCTFNIHIYIEMLPGHGCQKKERDSVRWSAFLAYS